MPHLHTEPGQHDFTVSAYIVRLDTPEPAIILHRHKLLGKYMQFGGHVELHETPWQALIHEIAEESGYQPEQLKILQPAVRLTKFSDSVLHPQPVSIQTHPFGNIDHYHTDIAFAFVTNEPPRGTVGEHESADIKTFTAAELAKLGNQEIIKNVRETAVYVIDELLRQWQPIDTSEFDV